MPKRRIVGVVAAFVTSPAWMMPSMFMSAIVSAVFPTVVPTFSPNCARHVEDDEAEVDPHAQVGVKVAVVVEGVEHRIALREVAVHERAQKRNNS